MLNCAHVLSVGQYVSTSDSVCGLKCKFLLHNMKPLHLTIRVQVEKTKPNVAAVMSLLNGQFFNLWRDVWL